MNEPIHMLVYVKRQLGSGRRRPNQPGGFAEQSLTRPGGHGFGQRWLFNLARDRHDIVIWLFSVIRHKNLCLPPSLDARIKVISAYERLETQSVPGYIERLLSPSHYRYAFEADPVDSYYLPWNDATTVLSQIIPDFRIEVAEPEVMPFSIFSSVMPHFQTPRKIGATQGLVLDTFAQKLCKMPVGFLSYRRKDASVIAMQTAARMYHHGVAPWWDQWAMPRKVAEEDAMLSDQAMTKAVEAAIGRSKYAVTLHSRDYASVRSPWTKFEHEIIECAAIEGRIKYSAIEIKNELSNEINHSKELVDHELQKLLTDACV